MWTTRVTRMGGGAISVYWLAWLAACASSSPAGLGPSGLGIPMIEPRAVADDGGVAASQQPGGRASASPARNDAGRQVAHASLPLVFEPNVGQADDSVRYLARGPGYGVFLLDTAAIVRLTPVRAAAASAPTGATETVTIRMEFAGARSPARTELLDLRASRSHYFIGPDAAGWRRDVPHAGRVAYRGVYDGIDVQFYGVGGQLEYDLLLAPHADADQVRLRFDGALRLRTDPSGDLAIDTPAGPIIQRRPVAYQEIDHTRRPVRAGYALVNDREVQLTLGAFDPSHALVIDPIVSYATFLGGSGLDRANAVAVNAAGEAYIAGVTASTDFPTGSAVQPGLSAANDVFVAKVNAAGTALVYSTYLGGTSTGDAAYGLAVDGAGAAYVTGVGGTGFPTTPGAYRTTHCGSGLDLRTAFVTKLATGGSLAWSTLLCSIASDSTGRSIAVNQAGEAFVTGETTGGHPVTPGAYVAPARGSFDVFVTKLAASGASLVYSAALGGSSLDYGYAIAIDAGGAAYVTGETSSSNYPTVNPFQGTNRGSSRNAFVSKLNAAGTGLVYSTYLGGTFQSIGYGIAVNAAGEAYVTGTDVVTAGTGGTFPLQAPIRPTGRDGADSFLTRLTAAGSALVYSTYLGASSARAVALDAAGRAYVVGSTGSGLQTVDAVQSALGGADRSVWSAIGNGTNWGALAFRQRAGEVRALLVDAQNPIHAGTADGFVFRWGGSSWTRVAQGLPAQPVNSLARHPANPTTLWAATSVGVYKTIDGGQSWVASSAGIDLLPVNAIAVDPANGNTLYAGVGSGLSGAVFRSLDGGATWQRRATTVDMSVASIAVHPTIPQRVYAGPVSGRTPSQIEYYTVPLLVSTDGFSSAPAARNFGVSAIRAIAIDVAAGRIHMATEDIRHPLNPSSNLAYCRAANLDASQTDCTVVRSYNSVGFLRGLAIAVNPAEGNAIYLGTNLDATGTGLYISTNGGNAFSPLPLAPAASATSLGVGGGPAVYAGFSPTSDVFMSAVDAAGTAFTFATYLGGIGADEGLGVALDANGRVYVAGMTASVDWPASQGAVGQRYERARDALLARIDLSVPCTLSLTPPTASLPSSGGTGSIGIAVAAGCTWGAGSQAPWLSLTGSTFGNGNGTVTYSVDRNTGAGRSGSIAIGSAIVTVTQTGPGGDPPPPTDADGDSLLDSWETTFGLSPSSATGIEGGSGDPDADGRTNLEEQQAGTHPRGFSTRYFAEGVVNAFFETEIALLNAGTTPAIALVRVQPQGAAERSLVVTVPALTRRTLTSGALAVLTAAPFSTVVESDAPIVADRTVSWDASGYGAHAETSIAAPSTIWYLAEGSTAGPFVLFYLLQNPNAAAASTTITFLRPLGLPPIAMSFELPPNSRTTIPVDGLAGLSSTDVSASIASTLPIIVERAMYLDQPGQAFVAGHGSAGVTAPALQWFLAEGATGSFFELFILVANPNPVPAQITADYLLTSGAQITKSYTVPAEGRFTIWVDAEEIPSGSGNRPLANVAVSTTIRSTNNQPIIVERAMWWPQPAWYEAHNSPGVTATGTRWALAAGEAGGPRGHETYVLIANTSATGGQVRVTFYYEDGSSQQRTYTLLPNSRFNVSASGDFPGSVGRRFGVVVESLGTTPAQIVVERAMYSNAGGVLWSAGTAAVATRLSP